MTSWKFNPEVSLGHMVQILALIIGLTAGWFQFVAQLQRNEARTTLVQSELSAKIEMNTMRVNSLQVSVEDKLRFIAESVADLKAARQERPRQ